MRVRRRRSPLGLGQAGLRQRPDANAFSLSELLVVIAIIGLINGLAIAFNSGSWQRERVNAVALGLAGWLEEVRNNALRQTSATPDAGGCVVSIASPADATAGTALATVSPSSCAASPTFAIPGVINNADRYDVALTNASAITFTPRGSVTSASDAVVRIFLRGSRQLRCVRVSAILGLVRVGSNGAAASSAATCTDFSRF